MQDMIWRFEWGFSEGGPPQWVSLGLGYPRTIRDETPYDPGKLSRACGGSSGAYIASAGMDYSPSKAGQRVGKNTFDTVALSVCLSSAAMLNHDIMTKEKKCELRFRSG
jgi:hypothetical protein